MTRHPTAHAPAPRAATTTDPARHASETVRVVDRALQRIRDCGCGTTPRVAVLRSFDGGSRDHAAQVTRRLRDAVGFGDVSVSTLAAPVLAALGRIDGHHCAVVDATGRPSGYATMAWQWEPNQPERGVLGVRVNDGDEVVLPAGAALSVRPGPEHLVVHWPSGHQDGSLRTTEGARVEVRQVEGIHLVYRDETLVEDAPERACIVHDPRGVARRAD